MRLCECGCGQPAPVATYTNRKLGYVRGEQVRFIRGHSGRKPVTPAELKLCECGCGQFAPLATKNSTRLGYVKGQSVRFCVGHYLKMKPITKRRTWPSIEERFWPQVDKSGNCWVWTGCLGGNGYGRIRYKGRQEGAHRVAWMLVNGDIPKGMMVMHSCDNPLCVRVDHLSLGSLQENVQDMVRKGRASRQGPSAPAKGERNGSAKLTAMDVVRIRDYHREGLGIKELANRYGVTDTNIRNIINHKTWKHIGDY